MLRRDFLRRATSVGLGGLLLPNAVFSDDHVAAENLYLYSVSKALSIEDATTAFYQSINRFNNVGINFDRAEVVQKPPRINNLLNICVVLFDNHDEMNKLLADRRYGVFGGDSDDAQYYREQAGLKYGDLIVLQNCAFVFPNVILDYGTTDTIRKVSSSISHEMGHAFGLGHIYERLEMESVNSSYQEESRFKIGTASEYVMAREGYGTKFHEKEVEMMKRFIEDTRRENKKVYVRTVLSLDKLTAQESSLRDQH